MNDNYEEIFDEIFGEPEHKSVALGYLASLTTPSENAEEHTVKKKHIVLLKEYFNNHPDGSEYYAAKIRDIEEIITFMRF